jgi:hypothetical protein
MLLGEANREAPAQAELRLPAQGPPSVNPHQRQECTGRIRSLFSLLVDIQASFVLKVGRDV